MVDCAGRCCGSPGNVRVPVARVSISLPVGGSPAVPQSHQPPSRRLQWLHFSILSFLFSFLFFLIFAHVAMFGIIPPVAAERAGSLLLDGWLGGSVRRKALLGRRLLALPGSFFCRSFFGSCRLPRGAKHHGYHKRHLLRHAVGCCLS